MTKHLSHEIINQLAENQLKGKEFTEALLHLNSCLKCQEQLRPPSEDEILKALFTEDDQIPNDTDDKNESEEKEFTPNQS